MPSTFSALRALLLGLCAMFALNACHDNDDESEPTPVPSELIDSNSAENLLSENAVNGDDTGLQLQLLDDSGAAMAASFSLADDAGGRFQIGSSSGVVTVADDTQLDFEDTESFRIEVLASVGDESLSGFFDIELIDETFAGNGDFDQRIEIAASENFESDLLTAMLTADPGTIIQLPAGAFSMRGEISTQTDSIRLRGAGMDDDGGTVLDFTDQISGGQSILATGDNFIIEDLAVTNTPSDSIKIKGANGVTIRRVRVEWTGGASSENGAYGLYPVQTRNVLIEDSEVRGASDAGVYVGQSVNVIVRRNYVYENVAGIEIENTRFADVYENEATRNTGGILVFDLPGPPVQGGQQTRVYDNRVYDNNTPNFSPGGVVRNVPGGTGIMVMANDDIEIFNNEILDNGSAAVIIASYYIVNPAESKPTYDPVPEKIYIHDNIIAGNATAPQDLAVDIGTLYADDDSVDPPKVMVDIFYDSAGIGPGFESLLLDFPDGLSENRRICIENNSDGTTFGSINGAILAGVGGANLKSDINEFSCSHPVLPEVALEPVSIDGSSESNVDTAGLCSASGGGVNFDAIIADCPTLSGYRLFADASDPTRNPNGRGIPYDLTSPLFTDYASKHRFVFMPEGLKADYRDRDVFEFPVGTIISKTFAMPADLRNPDATEEIIETRLLIRRATGWRALPYIWNEDKTDATLAVAGGIHPVSWIDAEGESRSTDYVIPNANQCGNCHTDGDIVPIGPKARLLNKDYAYDEGSANQLMHWASADLINGVPEDLDAIETIPLWDDQSASLDSRARGYLDINCAHCHAPNGEADTSGLYLESWREFGHDVGRCKAPVAAGDGTGGLEFVIVPGDASQSILPHRMDSNELEVMMPEIGRTVIHDEGVELVRAWIDAMAADDCGL